MILLDLNQTMMANLAQQMAMNKNMVVEPTLLRHMILNSIRALKVKFSNEYGALVVCCDGSNSWRRDAFPHYKASRKKGRDESEHDWNVIFEVMNEIRDDLKEHFPYRVLHVERAEADDIIAVLCHRFGDDSPLAMGGDPILIVSSDKDFGQLQRYSNVSQYSPIHKDFIRVANPEAFLREHVIRGDRGDGVPNMLSDDDTFVTEKRQATMSAKRMERYMDRSLDETWSEAEKRGYYRNKTLIDLWMIPEYISKSIHEAYDSSRPSDRSKMFNYFMSKNLRELMESITEF